jgi:drug/metabolite transporter (DMT)-like permease
MPLCGFLILMGLPVEFLPVMNSDVKTWFFLYQGIFTVFFPIAYLLLLKFGKSISSIHLHDRKERIPLFIGSLLFFIIDYVFVRMAPVRLPPIVYAMMLGGIISIMAAIAFTLKTKISIHAIGVAGVLGTLFAAGEHSLLANSNCCFTSRNHIKRSISTSSPHSAPNLYGPYSWLLCALLSG